jgi:high-affinity nickel-transport protein
VPADSQTGGVLALTEQALERAGLGLSRGEKFSVLLVYSAIAIATLIGFVASIVVGASFARLAALGILAYTLGLRHGVDADHIVAIDNTTRKLLQDGERPLTVGTWFSLGHSTVVVGLVVALVVATKSVANQIPGLQSSGAIIGTTVSGIFLFLIGLVNAIIVMGIYQTFKTMKEGKLNESELEVLRKPWQIYPVGVLFGLGFDTASEIALFAITVVFAVSSSIPLWMILLLPFLFTCGMVLADTTDGIAMRAAYGWAFLRPIRKIYYNLTVTVISVAVAFAIGGVELLQVLASELNLTGPYWNWLAKLDFETMGFGIIGIFLVAWLVSTAYWKFRRFDELYS